MFRENQSQYNASIVPLYPKRIDKVAHPLILIRCQLTVRLPAGSYRVLSSTAKTERLLEHQLPNSGLATEAAHENAQRHRTTSCHGSMVQATPTGT
jgi:hypothetical protein